MLNLIKAKAYLLCNGIRENEHSRDFYRQQNPYDIKKGGGYVGLHFLLGNRIPTLASTTFHFDKRSKFLIKKISGKFFFFEEKGKCIPITPIKMLPWYSLKTSSGKPMSQIFAHEGLHYLHQQYAGCDFQVHGVGCRFCGTGKEWLITTPAEIAETALTACRYNKKYQVCLGGGTTMSPGRKSEFFLECIQLIRKKNKKIPIWVEMVPPDTNDFLKILVEAGASAFGFNLEIWDNKIRKKICPGKSKIPKRRYFEAWEFVQKHLGPNKVNTVLITGLEPFESTLKGIHEISKRRVRITLLPFKPWDNSEFADKEPANPEELFKLAFSLAKDMLKFGIDPNENYGCANCSSCTIEDDILKYILLKKKK